MPEVLTLAAFSRLHNVSRKTTTVWKQRGWLVMHENGGVLVAASNARLAQRPAVYRGGRTSGADADEVVAPKALEELRKGGALLSLSEATRLKENYVAKLRRLEFEEASKKLVPVAEVEQVWRRAVAFARQHLLALPNAAADQVAGRPAPECAQILKRHVHRALQELSETTFEIDDDGDDAAAV